MLTKSTVHKLMLYINAHYQLQKYHHQNNLYPNQSVNNLDLIKPFLSFHFFFLLLTDTNHALFLAQIG